VQHGILDAVATKIEFHPAAAPVDNESDTDRLSTHLLHNLDHFTNGPARGDDILTHQDSFTFSNLETAPKLHRAILPLREQCAGSKLSPDFLPDDDPTECRRNDNLDLMCLEVIGNLAAQELHMLWILQDLRTLKVLIAVETRG